MENVACRNLACPVRCFSHSEGATDLKNPLAIGPTDVRLKYDRASESFGRRYPPEVDAKGESRIRRAYVALAN